MSRKFDRRQALGAIGTVSLGGLLTACGGDADGGSASVATTAGETATVEPKTTTSDATGKLFDGAASCALTVEQTEGPYYFDADKVLYFDDDVSDKVYERSEYSARGERDQLNEGDGIFDRSLVMTCKRDGDGYLGVMSFDVRSA